jgi:deoxycytidine triphosphate deaminase
MIVNLKLIENGSEECYKPTTYDMRLGDVYVDDCGCEKKLNDNERYLCIQPHQAITVSTYENVKLPPTVAARFDLKLKWGLQGLMLQNGTQVEPGYYGKLYTLMFNLSNAPIRLCYAKDRLFAIEFFYVAEDNYRAGNADVAFDRTPNLDIERWAPDRPIQSGLSALLADYTLLKEWIFKYIPIGLTIFVTILTTLFFTFWPNFWSKSVYSKKEVEETISASLGKDLRLENANARTDSLQKAVKALQASVDSLKNKSNKHFSK